MRFIISSRCFLTAVAFTLMISAGAWPATAEQTGPTPYPDAKDSSAWPGIGPIRVFPWMTQNRDYFWTQRQKDQKAIVFVGDSLVGGWRDLNKMLDGYQVANRGIGGDVTRGVLFRLKEDVLDLNPRAVVIEIGTNDLSAHANPAGIAQNIEAIVQQIADSNSDAKIVLCTVPPRASPKAPTQPGALDDLNSRITKIAQAQPRVQLIDLHQALAERDGSPHAEYFADDHLHLAAQGYEQWAGLLKIALAPLKNKR